MPPTDKNFREAPILSDLQMMTDDADRLSDGEGAALLRWLSDGMMTQLGHQTRTRDGDVRDQLGICRKSTPHLLADDAFATRARSLL